MGKVCKQERLNKEQPEKDTKQEGHGIEQGILFREQLGNDSEQERLYIQQDSEERRQDS